MIRASRVVALTVAMLFMVGAIWGSSDTHAFSQQDEPWWKDTIEENGPYEPSRNTDTSCERYPCEYQGPWGNDYLDDQNQDDGYWRETDTSCTGMQCDTDRTWWNEDLSCTGYNCDDPWNNSTSGCHAGICNDGSYLVDCSYVTVSVYGAAGACGGPMGKSSYNNCYPVTGAGTMVGTGNQTFRCRGGAIPSTSSISLTDITTSSDENAVLLLCDMGAIPISCENAPTSTKYGTCERDTRFTAPVGDLRIWFVCSR